MKSIHDVEDHDDEITDAEVALEMIKYERESAQESEEKKELEKGYTQWSILGNGKYGPSFPTTAKLPAGFYEIKYDHAIGSPIMVHKPVNSDELFELPSKEIIDIIEDISKFWANAEKYKQYNFVHKRGILLYGEPGCGKSGIIQLCTNHLIKNMNGIVINITNADAIEKYTEFIDSIRLIEPNRPIIVILEDIDSIAGEERYNTSLILNILDGVKQIDNIVYIATTNYPEKLEERISNRPSRFDRRYEVEMPTAEVRESYLRNKLTKEDIKKVNITEWVEKSEGMSLAHMRELVISVMTLDNTFDETIERLNGFKIKPRIKSKNKKVGFGLHGSETPIG
jgi:hypothetical protein